MKYLLALLLMVCGCSGTATTESPMGEPCSDPPASDPPSLPPPPDAGLPLECPTCETCEVCAPPHVPGMLRCDELDVLIQPTCPAFAEACSAPSCPADWPIPIARHYLTPQRAGCLNSNAGLFACKVPGMNNTVFIDCCAVDVTATAPTCSIDSDCPHPIAECWDAWCNAAGICGADKAKTHGTPCSIGHCESGQCVP